MPPRAPKQSLAHSELLQSSGHNEDKFVSEEVEKYIQSIQSQLLIYERCFNLATLDCHKIWDLFFHHRWNQFTVLPITPTRLLLSNTDMDVVLEFVTRDPSCKRIYLRYWINREMKNCIVGGKVGIYFPHLITNLCRKVKVIIDPIEQSHQPIRSVIDDSMLHQFQALHRE
ncbi:hypothetical protein Goari_016633 [Gossypium aridum]|uniref:Uncharacterized protein n=1 Tax=Gossypium aridum TaxID=34290 RepID=A0A7J8WJM3_GOSAI|nr:hypothetical protein [Gossypium aridum]